MTESLGLFIAQMVIGVILFVMLFDGAYMIMKDYDYDGFNMEQNKSAIYTPDMTSQYGTVNEVTGKVINYNMFTKEHIIMLPAVDAEPDVGMRPISIYNLLTFKESSNPKMYSGAYQMTIESIYNKHLTLNGIGPYMNTIFYGVTDNFNGVVTGDRGKSHLLFYMEERLERQRRFTP